jgi:hypothetical protein
MHLRLATILLTAAFLGGDVTSDPSPYDACVRLGHGVGSGIIVCVDGEAAYGLTVSHLSKRRGSDIVFQNRDGTEGVATFVGRDKDSDLALFKCRSRDVIGVVPVLLSRTKGAVSGAGYTSSAKGKLVIKGLKPMDPVMISNLKNGRAAYAVTSGRFANGDSGGAVFEGGSLVSVLSHGEDDERALGATHPQILRFLKENGAKEASGSLVFAKKSAEPEAESRNEFPDWGDNDRTREIVKLWKAVRSREPGPPGADGKNADPSEIAALRQELASQRKLIDSLMSTPVTVQVLDPKTKSVVAEQKYPFGTPIKLILPTTKARTDR